MTRVHPLPSNDTQHPYEFYFGPNTTEKFSQYLDKNALNTNPTTKLTGSLLEALYDTSGDNTKETELELDMAKGFKGNPNIGSVVFHKLKDSPEYATFASQFQPGDKVFIVSSIFGGTGASGFPELVKAIRHDNTHHDLQSAVIGASLILPYFKLDTPTDSADTGAIDHTLFNTKTKAALGYYKSAGINDIVNAIYYVGDENMDNYVYAEGEQRQQNKAHVVEFVAATSIIQFLKDNTLTGANHNPYEFSIKDAKLTTQINLPDFFDTTHELVLNNLSIFSLAMKYYRDVVCGDRDKIRDSAAYYNAFGLARKLGKDVYVYKDIDEFLKNTQEWGYYSWLKEMNDHVHKLHLYNMESVDDKNNKQDLGKLFADKEISTGFFSRSPIKDDNIGNALDTFSDPVKNGDDTTFLKVLRDVAKNIYSKVK